MEKVVKEAQVAPVANAIYIWPTSLWRKYVTSYLVSMDLRVSYDVNWESENPPGRCPYGDKNV